MNAAVLLDRDGVLIEDIRLLAGRREVRIPPGVPQALKTLSEAGSASGRSRESPGSRRMPADAPGIKSSGS